MGERMTARDIARAERAIADGILLDTDARALVAEVRALTRELAEARATAEEAINEYEYAAKYKEPFLMAKHGDPERIAQLRAALARKGGE